MNEFTRLARPEQSQVSVDGNAKECPSDGFSYPTFRLLNKQARVSLSSKPLNLNPNFSYRLFATANTKGWFAAVTSSELICSPLPDLSLAFKSTATPFSPKRTIPLSPGPTPTIIAFASAETRLVVAFDGGQLAVYDSSSLFTPGSEIIQPLHVLETHTGPFRQIAPNPGNDPAIVDTLAVVRGDGCVQLFNSNLESQGGWVGSDMESTPVAVAWSPKGKHLALGLHSGDILTFLPSSPTSPHKHIPRPTPSPAPLVSLTWLAPGHTFRTSCAPGPQSVDPAQHILFLDTKSSSLTYAAPNHPFALPDRTQQAFVLALPRWDEDAASASESQKTLMVVADKSSTDIEILGFSSGGWHQQWQENQLALPLDKTTSEDTVLLALDVDLTDPSGDGVPVMYAYLNDGTLEGWFIEGTKPYVGMIRPAHAGATTSFSQPTTTSVFTQQQTPTSSFIQPISTPAFGQSTFGSGGSAFGTTGFGQTSSPSTFGQSTQPTFGQTSQPKSGFGAFASSPSAFGGASSTSNVFGSSSGGSTFGSSSTPSAFGGTFGASSAPSDFGKPSGGGFGSFTPSGTNVFGQTSFGFGSASSPTNSPPPTSPPPVPAQAVDMSREASMSDDTSFGGLSLSLGENNNNGGDGKDGQQKTGIFGSFSPPAAPSTTSTFGGSGGGGGGFLKPAAGFGAFSSYQSSGPGPGATTTGSDQKPSSAFGQSSFGQPSFGKPSFGQSGFGQSGFGVKPAVSVSATTGPSTGGGDAFSAFAAGGSSSFGGSGGGAFGSGGAAFSAFTSSTPSAFGQQQQQQQTGTSPFASTSTSVPAFVTSSASASPFGTQPQRPSSFRESSPIANENLTPQTPTKPHSIPTSPSTSPSPSSSPFLGAIKPGTEGQPTSTPRTSSSPFGPKFGGGTFGNITTTPSTFKPASGFGAFGSDTTPTSSPFFNPKTDNTPTAVTPVSAFATSSVEPQGQAQSSATTTTTTTTPTGAPTFGAPSSFGSFKSAFTPSLPTPVNTLSTGGFGAFSGSAGGFGAFAGQKKSFGELLRAGDEEEKGDPVKLTGAVKKEEKAEEKKEIKSVGDTTKMAAAEHEIPTTDAATKSPTPEVVTPKITTKTMDGVESSKEPPAADEEKPGKGLFFSKIPVSTSSSVPSARPAFGSGSEKDKEVASPNSTPKAPVSVFSPPPSLEDDSKKDTVSQDTSFGNLSMLSETSSFVEVEGEERGEEEEGEESPSVSDTDGEQGDGLEIGDESSEGSSFLSESYASSDESPEEDEESEEEDEEDEVSSPEPTAIPLPASRSPSATPQPELPAIHVTPSPSDSPEPGVLPTIPEEESTTPPGTPFKEPPIGKSPSPVPTSTPSPPPQFSAGLGRPSTRPTRSSPLASNPVSLEDVDEQEVPAPVPLVPLSPKPRFAVLPMPPPSPDKAEAEESSKPPGDKLPPQRPRTPPLLSFGSAKPATTPATPAPSLSTVPPKAMSAPPTVPPTNLFGKSAPSPVFDVLSNANKTAPTPAKSSAPSPTPGPSSRLSFPPPITAAATPSFGFFGTPPQGAPVTPQATPTPPGTGFGFGPFGLKGSPSAFPATSAPKTFFGGPSLGTPRPATTPAPPPTPSSAVKPAPPTIEEGMQEECASLFVSLDKEFQELRSLAQRTHENHLEFSKSAGRSRKKADLGVSTKWNLGDVVQFGQVLQQYEQDLSALKKLRDTQYQALRELQSNMLKAGTRREEIIRFNKAKNDSEFAKMLKSRTLGPEHLETQTQLRRDIRTMRDRVQKLEDHLKASKKKLAQVNTGKPGFRAPSLDTINRTYRNIDIAVQQQTDDVAQLTSHISKLSVRTSGPLKPQHPSRDNRLPDAVVSRRPYNVTPHIAITTAAALNAERAAHKLKRALLAARKEPLLNTKAAAAPPPPSGYKSPQKAPIAPRFGVGFSATINGPLFPVARNPEVESTPTPWTLPEDNFNPSTPLATRRGAGVGKRQHMSVPLRKSGGSAGPAASPPAATFEWGPLPVFEQAQGTTMVEAVKLTPPSSKPLAGGSTFGGWNVGLFGKKET